MSRSSLRMLLPLLMVPIFLGGLDTTLFNSVARDLPVLTTDWALWFVDAYAVVLASGIVLGSRLGARFGPGRALAAGLAVFAAASLAPAVLANPSAWVLARGVQGLGYALMVSSVVSCIGALLQGRDRARAYAWWTVSTSVGAGAGPLLGRACVDADAYRVLFWGPALVAGTCAVAAWVVLRRVEMGEATSTRLDVPSSVLAFAGLGLVVAGVQTRAAAMPRLAAVVLGAVVLLGFGRRQLRSPDPLIDVRVLRFSRLLACPSAIVLAYACYTGAVYTFGTTALSLAGLLPVSALALWVALGGLVFGRLRGRLAPVRVLQVSVLACAAGLALAGQAGLWVAGPLMGLGVGVASTAGSSYLLGSVEAGEVARAGALQETSFAIGSATGVAVVGTLLHALPGTLATCLTAAALLAGGALLLGRQRGRLTA